LSGARADDERSAPTTSMSATRLMGFSSTMSENPSLDAPRA
jgi:hypothetical protein